MTSLHRPSFQVSGAILVFLMLPGAGWAGSWEIGFSFPAPSTETNGLTYDGRYLWHTNDTYPTVYEINPFTGEVVTQMATTLRDQGDMEFGGKYLWINSENDHYIHKVDPASGKTLDSILVLGIPPQTGRPGRGQLPIQLEGLTFDGKYLWADGDTSLIIRIDPETKQEYMYEMDKSMGYLDGMAWAFDHLWIVTNNATIYEIDPCSMGILDKFDAPADAGAGPEGFAFDGENLWFADNELDQIYQIILKYRILTKRSALAKTAGSAGCNQGILLTAPVAIARSGTGASSAGATAASATTRHFFSTPLFHLGASPVAAGSSRFTDARGRMSPWLASPADEER
jgi:hypothetical protein